MSYYWGPPLSRDRPGEDGHIVVAPEARLFLQDMLREESPKARKAARSTSSGAFSFGPGADTSPPRQAAHGPRREEPMSGHCENAIPWQTATLFGGPRVVSNMNLRRGSAVMFRRPKHSRATPHERPIFLSGPNGTDPKMCVDIHNPARFSSFERGQYEAKVRQAFQASLAKSGSAPALTAGGGLHRSVSRSSSRASTPASSVGGHSRPGSVQGFLASAVAGH